MKYEDEVIINCLIQGGSKLKTNKLVAYSYISNPDHSIRWIYPSSLKRPSFLSFYNSSSLRSKVYSIVIKILFWLRLSKLIRSNEICLKVDNDSLLGRVTEKYSFYNYSIFTGTVGKNRKVIIELNDGKKSKVFVKVAISDSSRMLIKNEFDLLSRLNSVKVLEGCIPKVLGYSNEGVLELSSIKPDNYKQPSELKEVHVIMLAELNNINHEPIEWINITEKNEIDVFISGIKNKEIIYNGFNEHEINRYLKKVSSLCELISDEKVFSCGISHGDFTPWNMYVNNDKLYIYDWELGKDVRPILFDVFHFVFQSEVMIKHSDYMGIKKELTRVMKMEPIKILIKDYTVDVNMHFIFYLIYISSYYMNLYTEQESLHVQARWLYSVWIDAINDALSCNGLIFE